jgi:hypothetical protein
MVFEVAQALGELNDDVVFVGGAITEFYATSINPEEIRPTIDVDIVVDVMPNDETILGFTNR